MVQSNNEPHDSSNKPVESERSDAAAFDEKGA